MKARTICACAALALCLPRLAAGQSWDGTWKLNEAKSKLTGETYVIDDKGNGMMHVTRGAMTYDFACDGKAYPYLPDHTLTCTGSTAAGYDYESKIGQKVFTKSHRTFSADGKTMTVHGTDIREDGSTQDFTDVWKRLSGTSGLVGQMGQCEVAGRVRHAGDRDEGQLDQAVLAA